MSESVYNVRSAEGIFSEYKIVFGTVIKTVKLPYCSVQFLECSANINNSTEHFFAKRTIGKESLKLTLFLKRETKILSRPMVPNSILPTILGREQAVNEETHEFSNTLLFQMYNKSLQSERLILNQTEKFSIFKQLISGLGSLQRRNTFCGNICPENIYLDELNQVKIYHFFDASKELMKSYIKSAANDATANQLLYYSPEVLLHDSATAQKSRKVLDFNPFEADIFSLGLLMLDLFQVPLPSFPMYLLACKEFQFKFITNVSPERLHSLRERMGIPQSTFSKLSMLYEFLDHHYSDSIKKFPDNEIKDMVSGMICCFTQSRIDYFNINLKNHAKIWLRNKKAIEKYSESNRIAKISNVRCLAIADGGIAIGGCNNYTTTFWDYSTGDAIVNVVHPNQIVTHIKIFEIPDIYSTRSYALVIRNRRIIFIYDLRDFRFTKVIISESISQVKISKDSEYIVTLNSNSYFTIWETSRNWYKFEIKRKFYPKNSIVQFEIGCNNDGIFACTPRQIEIFSIYERAPIKTITHTISNPSDILAFALKPSNSSCVLSNVMSGLSFIKFNTDSECESNTFYITTITAITCILFHPNKLFGIWATDLEKFQFGIGNQSK